MSMIKYRIHEVAKDFGLSSKEISQILTDYIAPPKNHMQVLENNELDVIFEYLTQHNQAASLEEIFKTPEKAAPAKAPVAKKPADAKAAKPADAKPQKGAPAQTAAPAASVSVSAELSGNQMTLRTAIEKGIKEEARLMAQELSKKQNSLDIINEHLIPALDQVGKGFENGTVFLPQLLMSAEAAKSAFAVLKEHMSTGTQTEEKREKIVLATVKGDIHDIGKNIVKVLLENYNFEVIDLGKDVPAQKIVETAKAQNIRLVGLSALMTTTVVSMEETIKLLREELPECKVMVGGAVLNQEYADMIGADFYGKDAMQSVYYAQKLLQGK